MSETSISPDWQIAPGWEGAEVGGGSDVYYYYKKKRSRKPNSA